MLLFKPFPFESVLRKFSLDPVIVIFFKNAEKITSGGLILSLAEFGLIPYSYFFQKYIYVVKNASSDIHYMNIFLQKVRVWDQTTTCSDQVQTF